MRRTLLILTVVALMAAMLVASALPAFGDPGNGNGPNCQNGQFNAASNQPSFGGFLNHLEKGFDCLNGVPSGQSPKET